MEINIDNAFLNAIKVSIEPCLVKYHKVTEATIQFSHTIIFHFLRTPLFTTLLGFTFVLSILTAFLIVFTTIIAVLFIFIILLFIEGFLLIVCLGTICIMVISMIFLIIILFELKFWIYK